MAGHSKWANIQHRKGRQDAVRSKLFSKISKEITVAAKLGDPNPEKNPRLRLAVKEAKKLNIPVFAMVDTNSDPRTVDYVIPSNDDASKSISKILGLVTDAIAEGIETRKNEKEGFDAQDAEGMAASGSTPTKTDATPPRTARLEVAEEQKAAPEASTFENTEEAKKTDSKKETSKKNVFIAGSIPSQRDTYIADPRNSELILPDMLEQARIINDYVDFLYLDVISSISEVEAALNLSEKLNKKILIGIHLKKNGKLPSNESLKELLKNIQHQNLLGVICACVSPEISIQALDSFQGYGEPFGFKANLWKIKEPGPIQTFNTAKPDEIGTNPNVSFGIRDDVSLNDFYNFSKIMKENGATILGGCCETTPEHIKKISKLK